MQTKTIVCYTFLMLLGAATSVQCNPEEDFAFETFLMIQLKKYSTWLQASNLDPTPIMEEVIDISDNAGGSWWNYTASIWNQQILNHSKQVYNWRVTVDLDQSEFVVQVDIGNFTITGEYQAEGSYGFADPLDPFRGAGHWELTSDSPGITTGPYVRVAVENFGVTADGYVDLTKGDVSRGYKSLHKGKFGNLEAGEVQELVNDYLASKQQQSSVQGQWFPLPGYLEMFLKDVFAKTPLSDIIGSS